MLYIHTYLEFICLPKMYLDSQALTSVWWSVCSLQKLLPIKSLRLDIHYLQESLNFHSVNKRW